MSHALAATVLAEPTAAALRAELAELHSRVAVVEKHLKRLDPEVNDLRQEVAGLGEQVSRGNRINLQTQGEVREGLQAVQLQNAAILQLLKERA